MQESSPEQSGMGTARMKETDEEDKVRGVSMDRSNASTKK